MEHKVKINLKGITWGHTRGYAPLAVTSQIYRDFHPNVNIGWEQRSLYSFGEESIEEVVKNYDFVLIDHPFIGVADNKKIFLQLDKF
jgi:multiple sugar transport system substrate-binding protein